MSGLDEDNILDSIPVGGVNLGNNPLVFDNVGLWGLDVEGTDGDDDEFPSAVDDHFLVHLEVEVGEVGVNLLGAWELNADEFISVEFQFG